MEDLTAEQVRAIQDWAHSVAPHVTEVRLFGSRAKGEARPDSDVDLAVTAPHAGTYVALADGWERDLSRMVGLTVNMRDYMRNETIRRHCADHSVLLFPNEPGTEVPIVRAEWL